MILLFYIAKFAYHTRLLSLQSLWFSVIDFEKLPYLPMLYFLSEILVAVSEWLDSDCFNEGGSERREKDILY